MKTKTILTKYGFTIEKRAFNWDFIAELVLAIILFIWLAYFITQ